MWGRRSNGHLRTGREGERAAEEFLRGAGMKVLERNWRPGGPENLEVDLICVDKRYIKEKTLVFVEVKARKDGSRGHPARAVTPAKQEKLRRAASLYLSERDSWDAPCRFDVVCVTGIGADATVEHLENAF